MKTAIDDDLLQLWLAADRTNLPSELTKIDQLLKGILVPAVFISKMPIGETNGTPGCWLGGQPTLPTQVDWPWVQKEGGPSYPMHFIAQFDLAQLPTSGAQTGLPEFGTLFFFASYAEDVELGGFSSVIYLEEDVANVPLREMPQMPQGVKFTNEMIWWSNNPVTFFDYCPVDLSEYEAIDPNALRAKDGYVDEEVYAVALRALILQCEQLRATGVTRQSFSTRLFNWFKGVSLQSPRAHKTMHRLLSADTGFSTSGPPDQSVVRLLTVEHDPDLNFDYASGALAFFISTDDLIERRFGSAYARQETD